MPVCLDSNLQLQPSVTLTETCQYVLLTGAEAKTLQGETFNSEVFQLAVLGTLGMWATGCGVGLLINILRRAKI